MEAEREFLGNFEKTRKIIISSTIRKETTFKVEIKSRAKIKKSVEENKKIREKDINIIKKFMRDMKKKLKSTRGEIKELKD